MNDVKTTTVFTAVLLPTGKSFVAIANETLLQSAKLANTPGLLIDSSCRNGTCRTCICKLVKGKVAYRITWPGVSADEKQSGFILPCVAYPLSDVQIQLAV